MTPTSEKVATEMPDNTKGTTYSFDVCSHCKNKCCQDVKPPLTKNRKRIIRKYLKEQKIDIQKPFTKKNYTYPSVDELVYCLLFNKKTGKCSVHSVKPETCVSGPITFDINFSTKKVEWFLKKSELCAFAGILYKDKDAFKEHFKVAKKELTQLISQLDADELRTIAKIEEPKTFKIGEDNLAQQVVKKLGLK
jgi:Fe-S-cluster containining protein